MHHRVNPYYQQAVYLFLLIFKILIFSLCAKPFTYHALKNGLLRQQADLMFQNMKTLQQTYTGLLLMNTR